MCEEEKDTLHLFRLGVAKPWYQTWSQTHGKGTCGRPLEQRCPGGLIKEWIVFFCTLLSLYWFGICCCECFRAPDMACLHHWGCDRRPGVVCQHGWAGRNGWRTGLSVGPPHSICEPGKSFPGWWQHGCRCVTCTPVTTHILGLDQGSSWCTTGDSERLICFKNLHLPERYLTMAVYNPIRPQT